MPSNLNKVRLGDASGDLDQEDIESFIPIVDAIDFDAATTVALHARSQVEQRHLNLTCSVKSHIFGSYYLVCVLLFSDGVQWVLKIPRYGIAKTFGRLNQQKMISEIFTLRLIRSRTSLPVPEIYDWDTTTRKIGIPYLLVSFLPGQTVTKRWFDRTWVTEEKRLAILRNLAGLMSELHCMRFDKIGALYFYDSGEFLRVGELIAQTEGDIFHPEYEEIDGRRTIKWPEPSILGPFDSAKSYLLVGVDALENEKGLGKVAVRQRRADVTILRLAIDSIPESLTNDGAFVLAHPDFDSPNILIDNDGQITGVLDWDGVHTMPRSYGFSCYPSWITRDWDPIMYGYGNPDCDEDSPTQLSRYRQIYAAAFAEQNLPPDDYSPDDTRLSHIYEAIYIASSSFWNLSPIDRLLEHAFSKTMGQEFDVDMLRNALADELEVGRRGQTFDDIKWAFQNMWQPEWEDSVKIWPPSS